MINLKKTVLASLLIVSSTSAQDGGLKGLLTDDASLGRSKYEGKQPNSLGRGLKTLHFRVAKLVLSAL